LVRNKITGIKKQLIKPESAVNDQEKQLLDILSAIIAEIIIKEEIENLDGEVFKPIPTSRWNGS
jgi:hypothetical protein